MSAMYAPTPGWPSMRAGWLAGGPPLLFEGWPPGCWSGGVYCAAAAFACRELPVCADMARAAVPQSSMRMTARVDIRVVISRMGVRERRVVGGTRCAG